MRIAIVDDHQLFLDGMTALLSRIDDSFEIAAFTSGTELLASIETDRTAPELVISDLSMRPINGLALLTSLRAKGFNRPFILVSGVDASLNAAELKASGAFALVPKTADLPTLRDVISSALEAGSTCKNRKSGSISTSRETRGGSSDYQATALTPRQLEIIQIIVDGGTNRDIADKLNISENTVKSHLRQIFQVLEVNKRTSCISKARSLGLI